MIRQRHLGLYKKALAGGKVDKRMQGLIEGVFSKPDCFTTTTCSGRIVLLQLNEKEDKRENNFFAKWHENPGIEEVWEKVGENKKENLWFKQEPFVMVIGTKTIENARRVMSIARNHGVKKVGLMSFSPEKYLVEINGTHFMSLLAKRKGKLLVSREMLAEQLGEANKKLEANWKMLERFEESLEREL